MHFSFILSFPFPSQQSSSLRILLSWTQKKIFTRIYFLVKTLENRLMEFHYYPIYWRNWVVIVRCTVGDIFPFAYWCSLSARSIIKEPTRCVAIKSLWVTLCWWPSTNHSCKFEWKVSIIMWNWLTYQFRTINDMYLPA